MQPDERGVPVSHAAAILGISVAAARKRVQRGSLRSYKVDGQWMVVLPLSTEASQDTGMTVSVGPGYDVSQVAVIDDLRDRVRFLEGVVLELMRRLPELPVGTLVPTVGPLGPEELDPPIGGVGTTVPEKMSTIVDTLPQTPVTPAAKRGWLRRLLGL